MQLREEQQLKQQEFVQKMKELENQYKEGKMTKTEYQNQKRLLTREHAKDRNKIRKEIREERREERKADREQAKEERKEKRKAKRKENRS